MTHCIGESELTDSNEACQAYRKDPRQRWCRKEEKRRILLWKPAPRQRGDYWWSEPREYDMHDISYVYECVVFQIWKSHVSDMKLSCFRYVHDVPYVCESVTIQIWKYHVSDMTVSCYRHAHDIHYVYESSGGLWGCQTRSGWLSVCSVCRYVCCVARERRLQGTVNKWWMKKEFKFNNYQTHETQNVS